MTDPSSQDPASNLPAAPEATSDQSATAPKGLRRRLRWSTRGGEIIRSNGPHEVSVVESSGNAVARTPIPPREETRSLSGDRIAFGPSGQGGFRQDRFETGEAGPKSGDRFEVGMAGSPGASRFEGGPMSSELQDRMAGGATGAALKDRMAGGATDGGINDRMAGGPTGAGIRDRMAGVALDSVQDRMQGSGLDARDAASGQGPAVQADVLTDRYQGGGAAASIEDRYQGAGDGAHIEDRFEGAGPGKAGVIGSGQIPPGADTVRGRIDLPEDALQAARALHRGSRKPDRIDALLRQVPKPVFQPVEIFKDIEGLSQRMTGIRSQTADIRRRLAPGLQGPQDATSEVKMRKVSSWQKKKLPT